MTPRKPVPLADRVAASRKRAMKAGGRRIDLRLPPDSAAAAALESLLTSGYAESATACIARALEEAAERR
jgi:hypothetical protein